MSSIKTSTLLLSLIALGLPVGAVERENGVPLASENVTAYTQMEYLQPDKEHLLMLGLWERVYNETSNGEVGGKIPEPGHVTITCNPTGHFMAIEILNKEGKKIHNEATESCTIHSYQIPADVKVKVAVVRKYTSDVKVLYVH